MKLPERYQQQVNFMSRQADLLDEESNDVSAGVMRDAMKMVVDLYKALTAAETDAMRWRLHQFEQAALRKGGLKFYCRMDVAGSLQECFSQCAECAKPVMTGAPCSDCRTSKKCEAESLCAFRPRL